MIESLEALRICNSCEFQPMADGQESPSEPGLCASCLSEVRS